MQITLFNASMLVPLVQYLDSQGARAADFLDRVRIPTEVVAQGGWVTKKQAYDFVFDIIQHTGRQDAVYRAYLGFDFEHLGPVAQAMQACRTVKESLEVGTRLGSAAYEGNEYFLKTEGDTTWLCYREPKIVSAGQPFISDMTLTVYFHLIRAAADPQWRPERIRLQGETSARHRNVENFEDCRVEANPGYSAIAFPTEFLRRRSPWKHAVEPSNSPITWECVAVDSPNITDKLQRLLVSYFSVGKLPTLEQVSRMSDVSSAALKLALRATGTTYTGLLDRIRFDAACQLLANRQLNVREIACELEYSGTNNFVRAFRRLTGLTPGEYRQLQQTGED